MPNDIHTLRDTIFETIKELKDGKIDAVKANTISNLSQTVINSIRVEIDARRFAGSKALPSFIASSGGNDITDEERELASQELDNLLPKSR